MINHRISSFYPSQETLEQTWKNSLNVWVITEYDLAQAAADDKVLFSITPQNYLIMRLPGMQSIYFNSWWRISPLLSITFWTVERFFLYRFKFLFHHHCGQHKYIRTAFSTLHEALTRSIHPMMYIPRISTPSSIASSTCNRCSFK